MTLNESSGHQPYFTRPLTLSRLNVASLTPLIIWKPCDNVLRRISTCEIFGRLL